MLVSDLTAYLQEWDNASKIKRQKILEDFINHTKGKTSSELEQILQNGASLFFTRLTSWLRLSYMLATNVKLQLKAIGVFLKSSSGNKFLLELIEVGGILTLLEILGLQQLKEEDKEEALELLIAIAKTGRKYKELICESFGVRAIAECLAKSETIRGQDLCKVALKELSLGNPKFQMQVYKALIALLRSASPEAQQIAAQILQIIQPMIDHPSMSIIDPVMMLLRSLHLEVQYEAFELIKILITYENVKLQLLAALINALKPSKVDLQEKPEILTDTAGPEIKAPLPVYIQQASAAKLIGILVRTSMELAEACLELNCVHSLLYAMGTEQFVDSQKQAGLTLQFFIHNFEIVESKVRDAMGQTFFFDYMNHVDSFFMYMSPIHNDILLGNQVKIKINAF